MQQSTPSVPKEQSESECCWLTNSRIEGATTEAEQTNEIDQFLVHFARLGHIDGGDAEFRCQLQSILEAIGNLRNKERSAT